MDLADMISNEEILQSFVVNGDQNGKVVVNQVLLMCGISGFRKA